MLVYLGTAEAEKQFTEQRYGQTRPSGVREKGSFTIHASHVAINLSLPTTGTTRSGKIPESLTSRQSCVFFKTFGSV